MTDLILWLADKHSLAGAVGLAFVVVFGLAVVVATERA